MLTPQFILLILGIVLLALSVVLAVVAAVYFFRQNIRAVMDDLSGKTRQMSTDSPNGAGGRMSSRRRKSAPVLREEAMPAGAQVRQAPLDTSERDEDELSTVLDTKLRKVPHDASVNANILGVNDCISTLTTTADGGHQPKTTGNEAKTNTPRGDKSDTASDAFVVTRTIVSINAGEVISAGEE